MEPPFPTNQQNSGIDYVKLCVKLSLSNILTANLHVLTLQRIMAGISKLAWPWVWFETVVVFTVQLVILHSVMLLYLALTLWLVVQMRYLGHG